jgi:hypothetical protein
MGYQLLGLLVEYGANLVQLGDLDVLHERLVVGEAERQASAVRAVDALLLLRRS